MNTNGKARISLSDNLLASWFQNGFPAIEIAANPLPKDAQLIAANFDGQTVHLIYVSSEFDEVPEGHPIPLLDVQVRMAEAIEFAGADEVVASETVINEENASEAASDLEAPAIDEPSLVTDPHDRH